MPMASKNTKLEVYLPKEIIAQILPRLPVKSLLRFKCVSKEWYSLISDPKFAISQFQQKPLSHRLLFYTPPHFKALDLHTPVFGASVRNVACPFDQPDLDVIIMGSCNGLVCVALTNDYVKFFIWNPTTGFFKKLPDPTNESIVDNELYGYGFGYVSASDDYKLIVSFILDEEVTFIYSSKANSWKRVQDPEFIEFKIPGVLSNEALHWREGCREEQGIIALDLAKEEYHKLSLPKSENDWFNFPVPNMVSLDGCLTAMSFVTNGPSGVEFWVMKEYGVTESWTKFFKFLAEDVSYLTEYDRFEDHLFIPVHVESGRVVAICDIDDCFDENLIRLHREENELGQEEDGLDNAVVRSGIYSIRGWNSSTHVIKYDESLLLVNDYHGVENQNDSPRRHEEE